MTVTWLHPHGYADSSSECAKGTSQTGVPFLRWAGAILKPKSEAEGYIMTESLPTQPDSNSAEAQLQGDLYPDYEAYELDLKNIRGLVADFAHMYRGRLDNVAVIGDALAD